MKQVTLYLTNPNDKFQVLTEIAAFLNKETDSDSDWQVDEDDETLIEYDFLPDIDTVYWRLGNIRKNNIGSYTVELYLI